MRFLGQKPHHAFTGEVVIDSKKRPEGCRIKFRIRRNSVKLYDHLSVLRIETTINNPAEFKILNSSENVALFKALLAGEFHLNGFRNRDLQAKQQPPCVGLK